MQKICKSSGVISQVKMLDQSHLRIEVTPPPHFVWHVVDAVFTVK